jgi:hypothetical protein
MYSPSAQTSRMAAEEIKPHKQRMCDEILQILRRFPMGLTCAQIEGIAEMKHQTASARLKELRQDFEPRLVEYRIDETTKQWIRRENEPGKRTAMVNFLSKAGKDYLEILGI